MKITKKYLQKLIKEETEAYISEQESETPRSAHIDGSEYAGAGKFIGKGGNEAYEIAKCKKSWEMNNGKWVYGMEYCEGLMADQGDDSTPSGDTAQNWQDVFENIPDINAEKTQISIDSSWEESTKQEEEIVFQLRKDYILSPIKSGLMIIHLKNAHERIAYEQLNNKDKDIGSQQLLFPKEIELNKSEIRIITDMTDELKKVGFDFEVKENYMSINGIPPECQEENLQFVIENLIEQYKNSEDLLTEQQNSLAVSLATSLAINEVKKLSSEEMIRLKNELLKCETPSVCPSGKRTMINLKTADLEKYF